MAGLIARLFGGKPSPTVDMEPAPGIGGYHLGAGPANQTGFPGSTSQVRTNRGKSPRDVELRVDTDSGANNGLSSIPEVRQSSYRGDAPARSPRDTARVTAAKTRIRAEMQFNNPGEFFGGPALKTGAGNNTAGANPLSRSKAAGGHSERDTETPATRRQPQISGDVPGAENVRNTTAQRYTQPPGILHSYQSAPRADQAPVNHGGQATDGNVHPERVRQDVVVPNRFVFEGGGVQTWAVQREMPYGGRGDGARGADLNGSRYYSTGQADQFWNAGQGDYGIERQRGSGNKRPVSFTQPAPWTAQFYDTTASVGTQDNPNMQPAQQPQAVYTSPGGGRASNSTGRRA